MTCRVSRTDRRKIRRLHSACCRLSMLTVGVAISLLLATSAWASRVSLAYQDVSLECPVENPKPVNCTGTYDDALHGLIDGIIANMSQSNDQLGLPPLDPLVIPNIDLNLSSSFIDVKGNLSLEAVGLNQLEHPFARFCLTGFLISLQLKLPSINVTGSYAIEGWLGGDLLYVYGDGPWSLAVEGIELNVTVGLKSNTTANHMYAYYLELGLGLAAVQVDIEGLYHDQEVSEVLSEVLSVALPRLLDIYRQQVTCYAADAVFGLLNEKLLNVTMSDLTCLVAGLGCRNLI